MKKLFLLLALLPFVLAVQINSNTTINSTENVSTFFDINMSVCVTDNASGNVYCARNVTYTINQTQYVNTTINNTIYPICASYSNTTVQFSYPSFGVSELLNYSCFSGEKVFAPPLTNNTNYVNVTVETQVPQPLELNLTLMPGEEYRDFNFSTQRAIFVKANGTCEVKQVSNATQESCQPFVSQAVSAALAATPVPSAQANSFGFDGQDWWLVAFAGLACVGVYLYRQQKNQLGGSGGV